MKAGPRLPGAQPRGGQCRDYFDKAGTAARHAEGDFVQIDEPYLMECFTLIREVTATMAVAAAEGRVRAETASTSPRWSKPATSPVPRDSPIAVLEPLYALYAAALQCRAQSYGPQGGSRGKTLRRHTDARLEVSL